MGSWDPDDITTYSDFGHPEVANDAIFLIESGIDPNAKDDILEATSLIKTSIEVNENSLRVAKALLKAGADINLTNKYGVTALHELISHHHPNHFNAKSQLDRAKFLISKGAQINTIANGYCTTPLHNAVFTNSLKMVTLLVKNGADTKIRNSSGQTPKELALQEGFKELINLL